MTPDGSVFYSAECSDGSLIGRISTAGERVWELRLDTVATNPQAPFIADATAVSATGVSVSPDGTTVYVSGRYAAPDADALETEVHPATRLESCVDKRVVLSGGHIAPYVSDTIVWTAGQRPAPLAAPLPTACVRSRCRKPPASRSRHSS